MTLCTTQHVLRLALRFEKDTEMEISVGIGQCPPKWRALLCLACPTKVSVQGQLLRAGEHLGVPACKAAMLML